MMHKNNTYRQTRSALRAVRAVALTVAYCLLAAVLLVFMPSCADNSDSGSGNGTTAGTTAGTTHGTTAGTTAGTVGESYLGTEPATESSGGNGTSAVTGGATMPAGGVTEPVSK